MKAEHHSFHSILNSANDRRRILAPRTSEDEALFIARKYLENKAILEAKLANAVNGGRILRQNMLDVVAAELSAKFNVATRNRKYVEQKLRDMKKEARKYLNMAKSTKVLETGEIVRNVPRNPPEPIRVMMEAMADENGGHLSFSGADSSWTELDFSDTTSKAEGSEGEEEYSTKSPNGVNSDSVASTSSSSSIDLGSLASASGVLGIDSLLGAYFNQPMFAAMASLSNACSASINNHTNNNKSSDEIMEEEEEDSSTPIPSTSTTASSSLPKRITIPPRRPVQQQRFRRRPHHQNRSTNKVPESHILAAKSFRRLCDTLLEIVPRAAKTFEDACKLQSEYFEQLKLQISIASFASQANHFRSLS